MGQVCFLLYGQGWCELLSTSRQFLQRLNRGFTRDFLHFFKRMGANPLHQKQNCFAAHQWHWLSLSLSKQYLILGCCYRFPLGDFFQMVCWRQRHAAHMKYLPSCLSLSDVVWKACENEGSWGLNGLKFKKFLGLCPINPAELFSLHSKELTGARPHRFTRSSSLRSVLRMSDSIENPYFDPCILLCIIWAEYLDSADFLHINTSQ